MKKTLCCAILLFSSTTVLSDTLGIVYAGASQWDYDVSGFVNKNGDNVALEQDLKLEKDTGRTFFLAFEHPLPGIPNFRISQLDLNIQGVNNLSRTFDFGGVQYTVDTTVSSQLDLSHTNYVAYYEVLDNWINLDLGIEAKHLDGGVSINTISESNTTELDEYIPSIYANAQFDLPFTGWHAGAALSGITYEDDKFQDSEVYVGWESEFGLGSRFAYRRIDIEFELDDVKTDSSLDGFQVMLYYHF